MSLLTACVMQPQGGDEVEWVLESIEGQQVPSDYAPRMRLSPAGDINGFAGCNQFHGHYRLSDNEIEIGRLASTRKLCPPEQMKLERRFLSVLEQSVSHRIEDGGLILDSDSDVTMVFVSRKVVD